MLRGGEISWGFEIENNIEHTHWTRCNRSEREDSEIAIDVIAVHNESSLFLHLALIFLIIHLAVQTEKR